MKTQKKRYTITRYAAEYMLATFVKHIDEMAYSRLQRKQ